MWCIRTFPPTSHPKPRTAGPSARPADGAAYAEPVPDSRRGLLLGVAAYSLWGAFPLYWPLLEPAGAIEILAHRILWSLVTMGVLVVRPAPHRPGPRPARATGVGPAAGAGRRRGHRQLGDLHLGRQQRPRRGDVAGLLHQPAGDRADGRLILRERLRPLQWAAMGVAGAAVVVLTLDYGRPPWVALMLAFSFGSYGLAKKTANAGRSRASPSRRR